MKPKFNLHCKPQRIPVKWTEDEFIRFTGRKPEQDDLDRCNCKLGGQKISHINCGICIHMLPIFMCDICFPWSCRVGLRSQG